jgi:hypothetical protein
VTATKCRTGKRTWSQGAGREERVREESSKEAEAGIMNDGGQKGDDK